MVGEPKWLYLQIKILFGEKKNWSIVFCVLCRQTSIVVKSKKENKSIVDRLDQTYRLLS